MFKRIKGKNPVNGNVEGVPKRLGGQDLPMVAEHWGSGWQIPMARSNVTRPKALFPQADPSGNFGGLCRLGTPCQVSGFLCWYNTWWKSTMARWFWHVSSAEKQQFKCMQGTISGTKCPLYPKTVPLFLSLNVTQLFRSKPCLWKCRRTYWLSKLNTNKTRIMSHYLCSGAIMLLFIALTVITVSSDLTATHPLMIYPKQGFIWKRKISQVLVIS